MLVPTNLRSLESQKSGNLIYTVTEAWNHTVQIKIFTLEQTMQAQRGNKGTATLFL